jgi:osmotically-inducible protein OsmY
MCTRTSDSLLLRSGMLATLLILALSAPAQAAGAPTDAWITAKVKLSLATADGVRAADVNVDTVNRQVTLHGTVRTAAEKQAAERTAKLIEGTASVRNLLQVVPERNEDAVEAKDDEIQSKVSAALAAEPSLRDSSITVQSVNKGVVLLKGEATTVSDHLTAVQLAGEVRGVRRVASEAQSTDALVDDAIWKEDNVPVGGTSLRGVRSATNDLYLTSMVKMRLLANNETPALDINVDTRAAVVTLFGLVPSAGSRSAAEREAREVSGVASVRNQLEIVPRADMAAVTAGDDVIRENIKVSLGRYGALSGIDVEVSNGVARLTGSVASGVDRLEAMQRARATPGVGAVRSDLMLR